MRQLAEDIKSGAIRSKSGEGFFVLKGEYYDAIEAGRKTTEYRDLTPRNLSLSIGIKTVKFQRGYGHPGQPPKQMRFEVSSVRLLDASDRECDPYAIPPKGGDIPESRIAIAEGMCYTTSMKQRKSVGVRAGRSRMSFALVPVQEKTSLKV